MLPETVAILLTAVAPVMLIYVWACVPATALVIPWKLLLVILCVVATVFATLNPVKVPEFAKTYLTNPRADVPILFVETFTEGVVPVIDPDVIIPVTAVTVPETAIPRMVLFDTTKVFPVAVLLIPNAIAVAPVVEASTPDEFERGIAVKPVLILSVVVFPIVLLLILNTPAVPAVSIPVNPPLIDAVVPTASIAPIVLFWILTVPVLVA